MKETITALGLTTLLAACAPTRSEVRKESHWDHSRDSVTTPSDEDWRQRVVEDPKGPIATACVPKSFDSSMDMDSATADAGGMLTDYFNGISVKDKCPKWELYKRFSKGSFGLQVLNSAVIDGAYGPELCVKVQARVHR